MYNIPIETITIADLPENNALGIGATHQLKIKAGPDNATDKDFIEYESSSPIQWYSSDYSIISVGRYTGIVTAQSCGTAVITATYGNLTNSVTISVKDAICDEIEFEYLSGDSVTLFEHEQYRISATAKYQQNSVDANLSYSSSNTNVVSVSESGSLTANSAGTATITVSATDTPTVFKNLTVTVLPIQSAEIVNLPENNSIKIFDKNHCLDLEITTENGSSTESDPIFGSRYANFFDWSSSNPDVATVDDKGYIWPHTEGTTTITVSRPNGGAVLDGFTLTVTPIKATSVSPMIVPIYDPMFVGEGWTFEGYVEPENATEKRTVCISSNPSVVSVESKEVSYSHCTQHTINALAEGTATIRLEAYDDPSVCYEFTVNVEWREANYEYDLTEDYIMLGNSRQILTPGGADYIASIEDPSILSTDGNGKITALKTGTTKITIGTYAVTGAKPHECTITVLSYADFEFLDQQIIYYGETYTITQNANVQLTTSDTDKIEIVDSNKIKAIGIGWASVDVYYRGVCIHTIDFYVIESIAIVNKPTNNCINVGETYESLGAKELPTDAWTDAEWSSSDESVAEIYYDYTKGRVVLIGKSEGSVWINAESPDPASSAQDGFWLYVDLVPVQSFWIDYHPNHTELEDGVAYVGEFGFLRADIYPQDYNSNAYYNKIEWYVSEGDSDSVIFEPAAEKESIRVYALKPGNIEISAIIDDSIIATMSYPLEILTPSSVITVPTNRIIQNGTEYTFNADIMPEYAIGTWSSSNINVGTIDSNGVFKALSNGKTEITLSYKLGSKTYSHTVKIYVSDVVLTNVPGNRVLFVDGKRDLDAKVHLNNTTSEDVVWTTSNSSVATVNSSTGEIIGKSAGEVTITAKYKNDTSQKAWVTITVKKTKSYYF